MKAKTLTIDTSTQILIGTWLDGRELQHLKVLQPSDISDDADIRKIVGKIKSYYASGISKGIKIGPSIRLQLMDELKRVGYDDVALCDMVDKAKESSTAYIQQVSRLYEHKSADLLKSIDYDKPGGQQQAKQVMDTYTLNGVMKVKEPALGLAAALHERRHNKKANEVMRFGRTSLLDKIGGIARGQMISITAPPSGGKSSITGQMAIEAAKKKYTVLYVTMEMSLYGQGEIGDRWLANLSNGPLTLDQISGIAKITTKEDAHDYNDAVEALDKLIKGGYLIPVQLFGEDAQLSQIEELLQLHNPDIVILDQLTQLKDDRRQFTDTRLRYCHLTSSLKGLAQATDTAVILVCQANRQATLSGGKPNITWHKESASIEEDSDKCLALKEPDDGVTTKHTHDVNVWVTKNRSGRKDFFLTLCFNTSKQRWDQMISEERYA